MASQAPRHPTKPPVGGPGKFSAIPTEWRLELPESGATPDAEFGGCRSIEAGYHRGNVLGQGTYGEVYLATDLRTREKVAAKKIKMDNEKEGFPITAIREIKILSALANAPQEINGQLLRNNVIGLREIVRSGSHKANNYKGSIYMMFDYMDHDMTGLLERTNREKRPFNAAQVKCYLRQLFSGLALLEINEVLHRDLKNANLLVNNKGELKIADFGLARYFRKGGDGDGSHEAPMTQRVITLWYRPPELFLGAHKYGPEVDMWSAGCIMFELLTGKPLFPGKDEGDQLDKILTIMGQPTEASMPGCTTWDHYSMVPPNRYPARSRLRSHCESRGVNDRHALDLLEKLLALNPAARIRAQHAFMDPYFYEAPLPCKPSDMPKFETSHEMAMKRARHEGRYQQQQQQQQGYQAQQAQRRQQGAGQGPGGYKGQQGARGGQAAQGGPPAQRQRTQGSYGGPTMGQGQGGYGGGQQGGHGQPYRGGGAPAAGMAPPGQQQQYRGSGTPAAGGMPGAGGRTMPGAGLAAGMMPPGQPVILTQAQVQGMMAQGLMAQQGMMPPGAGGYGGGYGQQPGRAPPGGFPGQHGRPNPHGGAEPEWNRQRR